MGPILPYLIGLGFIIVGGFFARQVWPLVLVISGVAIVVYGTGSGINVATNTLGLGDLITFDSDLRREVARESLLKTGFYVDRDVDYAHVYGTFTNGSNYPIAHAWVECRVEITDWSGTDEVNLMGNVGPWKSVIEPGQTVEFDVASTSVTPNARVGDGHCQMAFKVVRR